MIVMIWRKSIFKTDSLQKQIDLFVLDEMIYYSNILVSYHIIGDVLNKIQLHCRLQKCTNRKDDVLLSNIFGDTISIKNGT